MAMKELEESERKVCIYNLISEDSFGETMKALNSQRLVPETLTKIRNNETWDREGIEESTSVVLFRSVFKIPLGTVNCLS